MTVLETVVIPFNYIPIKSGGEWIRTTEPEGMDLRSIAFSQTSLLLHKWRGTESNRRHTELQSVALPTELPSHRMFAIYATIKLQWRIQGSNL